MADEATTIKRASVPRVIDATKKAPPAAEPDPGSHSSPSQSRGLGDVSSVALGVLKAKKKFLNILKIKKEAVKGKREKFSMWNNIRNAVRVVDRLDAVADEAEIQRAIDHHLQQFH